MDWQPIETARNFAIHMHRGQKYSDRPYVEHLEAVVAVLMEFGNFDSVLLQSGYLHDVLEDTPCTEKQLGGIFGKEVANLVELVTDKPGRNRAERHAATYPRIAENPRALTLKLSDRIANARASAKNGLLSMYKREYPAFAAALRGLHHGAMWRELDVILALPAPPQEDQSND